MLKLQVMNVPISYVMLKQGMAPETVMVVAILLSIGCLLARTYMLRGMIGLSIRKFLSKVVINVIAVSCVSVIVPYIFVTKLDAGFLSFIYVSIVAVICSAISIYFVGCNKSEKEFVNKKIMLIINKKKNVK